VASPEARACGTAAWAASLSQEEKLEIIKAENQRCKGVLGLRP